jgi:hypothetical protein
MRVIVSRPETLVVDDFLDQESLGLIWAYIQTEEFEHVHRMGWVKAWRLSDGAPLRGPVTLSHSTATDRLSPVYPTGKAIDLLIGKIIEIQNQLTGWVGEKDKDWSHFFCRPYIYGAETGLSWHRDNENNTTGAFTYYCHQRWNVQWGGELLIANISTKDLRFPATRLMGEESRFIGTHFDNSLENERLLETGEGMYIFPKPNRLVVVPGGVLHCIKKVDASAGNCVRASMQGTFMFPNKPECPR